MKKQILWILAMPMLAACTHSGGHSSKSVAADMDKITQMQGCFEVGFNFAETFPVENGYKLKKPHQSKALELVVVDESAPGRVELQHILVIEGRGALKHWRQEWIYEPKEILDYTALNQWERRDLKPEEVRGQWLQRVTQVDDTPRYECVAPWTTNGKNHFWECEAWTPLPRREYKTRKDYEVLKRVNRQKLTDYGWIHEQDNEKLNLQSNPPKVIVRERGENTYRRVDLSRCQIAADWWRDHRDIWREIRASWNDVKKDHPKLKLAFKDAEGDLWPKLFELGHKASEEKWPKDQVRAKANEIISTYLN